MAKAVNSFHVSGFTSYKSLGEKVYFEILTYKRIGKALFQVRDWTSSTSENTNTKPYSGADFPGAHWIPIELTGNLRDNPQVQLCKLNILEYSLNPHLYPMFKDLVMMSRCSGGNIKSESLNNILRDLPSLDENITIPSGFIFHESRVGSTLIANMLASDPKSLVFSESSPPMAALLHCRSCSRERKVELFRDIVRVMSTSAAHDRVFFKFQSISNTAIDIALEVCVRLFLTPLLLKLKIF
jgi:hypothetical protein